MISTELLYLLLAITGNTGNHLLDAVSTEA